MVSIIFIIWLVSQMGLLFRFERQNDKEKREGEEKKRDYEELLTEICGFVGSRWWRWRWSCSHLIEFCFTSLLKVERFVLSRHFVLSYIQSIELEWKDCIAACWALSNCLLMCRYFITRIWCAWVGLLNVFPFLLLLRLKYTSKLSN